MLPSITLETIAVLRPHKCVVCTHRIWAKKSVERGSGDHCWKRWIKGTKGIQLKLEDYGL